MLCVSDPGQGGLPGERWPGNDTDYEKNPDAGESVISSAGAKKKDKDALQELWTQTPDISRIRV